MSNPRVSQPLDTGKAHASRPTRSELSELHVQHLFNTDAGQTIKRHSNDNIVSSAARELLATRNRPRWPPGTFRTGGLQRHWWRMSSGRWTCKSWPAGEVLY